MNRFVRAAFLALLCLSAAGAETFRFGYARGDKFRVLSTVSEEVRINRALSHVAEILNRIAFQVAEVKDGSFQLKGEFRTSIKASGASSYVTEDVYDSEYWCSPFGVFTIDPKFYMPTVRSVPTFPDRDLKPGDTWNAPGEERHDFRRDFGIPDPYVIPFTAAYQFVGPTERNGKRLFVIKATYTIFHQPVPPRAYTLTFPTQIVGFSNQTIYWDPAGRPDSYEETFKFVFDLANGQTVEYRGTAKSEVVEAALMNRDAIEHDVAKAVEGLKNVTVEKTEDGVTIRIENIQFGPESAVLLSSEQEKLRTIADILKRYPDRDILIGGHTALAGSKEGRDRLSKQRAQTVADFLIGLGVRSADHVAIAGYGAERPIAPNDSEANMSRNRRVEITILEN